MAVVQETEIYSEPQKEKSGESRNLAVKDEFDLSAVTVPYLERLIDRIDRFEGESPFFFPGERIDSERLFKKNIDAPETLIISMIAVWNKNLEKLREAGHKLKPDQFIREDLTYSQLRKCADLSIKYLTKYFPDGNLGQFIEAAELNVKKKRVQRRGTRFSQNGNPNKEIHSGIANLEGKLFDLN